MLASVNKDINTKFINKNVFSVSYSVVIYISASVLDLIIKYLLSVLILIIADLSVNDRCAVLTNTSYVYVDI